MKKYYFFMLSFLFITTKIFATNLNNISTNLVYNDEENNNLISINDFDNKIKLKILKPCVINLKQKEIINNNINSMDNLLNSIDTNKINKDVNNINKITKLNNVYSDYYNSKNVNLMSNIYKKIVDNLNVTNLYNIEYDYDSCININEYFDNNDANEINKYIFSDDMIDYNYVITNNITINNEEEIKLEVFIWDIVNEKFLDGKYYIIDILKIDANKAGNIIADFIFQKTTGESIGLFNSKIIYVSESGSVKNRQKQISIMNFDGLKNTTVTRGNNLKLTPIFSKYNLNEIFYLEYTENGAFIVRHNLKNNFVTRISTKDLQMTSAASFNPNGTNQIIVAGSEENNGTNLFLFDLDKKTNKKITNNKAINTSASFSPDGSKVVYVSDKTGSGKLYIKNIEDGDEQLITIDDNGTYDKPAWSPDGKMIAFIKISKGRFNLGVMTSNGEYEKMLTSDYLIEGVKWSPNSRYLIYTKQSSPFGKESVPKIYIMDIVTKYEYKLNTPEKQGASDPDWIMNL